jgi:xanthine dehydrogenase YagS FAD-binding subunit
MAPALIAMGGTVQVVGRGGERILPVEELWLNDTPWLAIKVDEIVREIRLPSSVSEAKATYLKFRIRKAIDFAIVSVAAFMVKEDNVVRDAKVVLGGVAPIPWRAYGAEGVLQGKAIDRSIAVTAGETAMAGANPSDINRYKVPLAKAVVKQALLAMM